MLRDNIKNLRKARGISQEELAVRLNVVRQTVSKWEQGLSVPDAEMLIKIAEALNSSVAALLDETAKPDEHSELKVLANKLEILNAQIARANEMRRKIWRAVFITAAVISLCLLLGNLVHCISFQTAIHTLQADASIIGGADGPTAIWVSNKAFNPLFSLITLAAAAFSLIGIGKTRKK